MGKSITQQKRGKGGPRYRAPSFKYAGKVGYNVFSQNQMVSGEIKDIVHSAGHSSPLMDIRYDNGKEALLPAPEGVKVGDQIQVGTGGAVKIGNVMSLKDIPLGVSIFNIESQPGDGGKFVRSSGGAAKIITKSDDAAIVLLPSSKRKIFRLTCRATIGIAAGAGRKEKPFLKAGKHHYHKKARNKLYPKVSGTSMNSVDHPFGGSSSHTKGRPTQSPRSAPPGRKVGKIAPRRTGKK